MSGSLATYRGIEVLSLAGLTVGGMRAATVNDAANLLERMAQGNMTRVMEGLKADIEVTMGRITRTLEERHGSRWPLSGNLWGTVPDRLARRSGQGLESIKRSVRYGSVGDSEVTGSISTGFMGIHETGGTITAKGGWLAIPMRAAVDGRGVGLSPRSFKNTFVARSGRGNLIIFRREGKDSIVPLFLLKKQVTIPPRLRLKELTDLEFGYFASKALQRVAQEFDL